MLSRLGAPEQTQVLGMRSYLLFARGHEDEAASMADRAAALVKRTQPIHVGNIDTYARIAHVQLAVWASAPRQRARERAAKARAGCADLAAAARIFPTAAPSYCLQEGTRRWLTGQTKGAL